VCPLCLSIETYLKLSNAPYQVDHCNDVFKSPYRKLPILAINNETLIWEIGEMFDTLRTIGYTLRGENVLSANDRADAFAYSSLIIDKLELYMQYSWWVIDDHYNQFTYNLYFGHLPFPLNYFLSRKMRKEKS